MLPFWGILFPMGIISTTKNTKAPYIVMGISFGICLILLVYSIRKLVLYQRRIDSYCSELNYKYSERGLTFEHSNKKNQDEMITIDWNYNAPKTFITSTPYSSSNTDTSSSAPLLISSHQTTVTPEINIFPSQNSDQNKNNHVLSYY